jgi:ferredoxin
VRIKLDRTVCDGFGACARRAPAYFSLDDWGYASLTGDGSVPDADRDAVMRALLDCPVHAIIELTGDEPTPPQGPAGSADADPPAELKLDDNEAEWGFTR